MRRRILLAAALTLLFAVLLPVTASARTTRPYQASFPAGDPSALAVDQSSGDVYAVSFRETVSGSEPVVSRFTATGAPDNFTAGPAAGTNTLTGFFNSAVSVAIDNSGGPLNGDVYVTEGADSFGNGKVKVFASSGASLGAISGSGTPAGQFSHDMQGVAVDQSSGALYISDGVGPTAHVWRYAPSSPSGSIDDADYTLSGITAYTPTNLAAASGSVYVRQNPGESVLLTKYAASSFATNFNAEPTHTTVDLGELSAGPTAVAVDPRTDDLYVDEGYKVAVFNSAGLPLYSFGAAAYFGNKSEAIAVKSAASGPAAAVYVADPQKGAHEVDVFGATTKVPTLTHPEVAGFGLDGTSSSSFASNNLSRLAFDQAARRLYALNQGDESNAPGIYGFDASAPPAFPPLSGFAPLSTVTSNNRSGLAVDNTVLGSAGNLYLASQATNLLYGWTAAGTPLGGTFPIDPATDPGSPNGSPTELCGAAVDSTGNVWVANRATKRILKYSSAGASLPEAIDTSAQGTPCQLAFDSGDNLYVSMTGPTAAGPENGLNSGVWKYTAASGYASATRIAASPGNEDSIWLAVDPSTDRLYVAVSSGCGGGTCSITSWIDEYDSSGNLVDEFATGSSELSGVAVDATNHDVYIPARAARKIRAFGPGVLLPEVTVRPASARTNTTATLNGIVNIQAVALSDCHFEYVSEAAFGLTGFSDLSSGGSVPCSPAAGSIPLDLEDHQVSASATGLSENTAYRFRLLATNANGTVNDEEALSSTGRPIVETTGSPVRTTTTARLEGRVDAHGEATTYHFEYGSEGPCDANPCESTEPHSAGSGDEIQLVSQQVEGLEPNTTYHYRVIADNGNSAGPGLGADMTVITRASDAPLSHGHFPGPPGSDRAYEQVSIPDSGGNPVTFAFAVSNSGDRAFYKVSGGTPISSAGTNISMLYAERTETAPHVGGWHSQDIGPPRDQVIGNIWLPPTGKLDLSDQISLSIDSVSHVVTIWRLRPGQPAVDIFQPESDGGGGTSISQDASRVLTLLKGSRDPAHPVAGSTANLYDVSSGVPHLVGLMPDGSIPACVAGPVRLSADGSLAFFGACGNLYMREIDAEQTKLIADNSNFVKRIPGAVFFTTSQSLEPDDTGGTDVYRYNIGDEALECVTCIVPGLDASVAADSIAIAADGSRVYFASSSVLLPGAATPGIYRVNVASGDLAYVAPASSGVGIGEDASVGQAITPDGSALVFTSKGQGLNAIGGQQNANTFQYYRYDDRDRSLTCLSCPQDGSAPVSSVTLGLIAPASQGANKTALSADGQTFAFATATSLLGPDQNTARPGQDPRAGADLYEWRDGRLMLITDGLTDWPANSPPEVTAITPSGKDILFVAPTQYTQDALDGYQRLYDARIGGGFEFPPPPKPCPLEVCQGTPKGAPEEQAPGTGAFAGPGNSTAPRRRPCPKGHHKDRKGYKTRCVKSQGKKQRQRQRAKHDRRAQR
jgi:sugar lactone lactonase YvrE